MTATYAQEMAINTIEGIALRRATHSVSAPFNPAAAECLGRGGRSLWFSSNIFSASPRTPANTHLSELTNVCTIHVHDKDLIVSSGAWAEGHEEDLLPVG